MKAAGLLFRKGRLSIPDEDVLRNGKCTLQCAREQFSLHTEFHDEKAAGLSGTTTLSSLATQSFGWGAPGPSAVIIATISGQPGEASIFAYDSGDGMFGLTAPARRVGLAMGNDTASTWTADAQVLFNAAINWALGL